MVMHYAQKVNQKRLATSAMAKWEKNSGRTENGKPARRKWQTQPKNNGAP
jgi:hypothetical protein